MTVLGYLCAGVVGLLALLILALSVVELRTSTARVSTRRVAEAEVFVRARLREAGDGGRREPDMLLEIAWSSHPGVYRITPAALGAALRKMIAEGSVGLRAGAYYLRRGA